MTAATSTVAQEAVVTTIMLPWRHSGSKRALADPAVGHLAAVACAGAPGAAQPVRWAMDDHGAVVRATPGTVSVVPERWADVFDTPKTSVVAVKAGDHVHFTLLAVPERSVRPALTGPVGVGRHKERGTRTPILTDEGIADWLGTRIEGKDVPVFGDVSFSFAKRTVYSPMLRHVWHAVFVEAAAVVVDPVAASGLLVGRYRAYGFGLAVFAP